MEQSKKNIVIKVDHLSKQYVRGVIGSKTVKEALSARFARLMGRPDSTTLVGQDAPPPSEAFLALDDVSFEVERGDAFGIIGKNGSGKSTLLKIISGITTPTSGSVSVAGSVASLLEVGVGFHPEMTGRENVYLNGAILGLQEKEIDDLFPQIVDFSEIGEFIDTPVKRYSSGMYVRLAFSVAAHLHSDIVILDEILAVGDERFQRKCLQKMESIIKDSDRTVLFVSHDASAVKRLCNKCVRLEKGRIVDYGPTEEVVKKYSWEMSEAPQNQNCYKKVFSPQEGEAKNRIRLMSVYTADEEGRATDRIDVNSGFLLAVEYEVPTEGAYAGFTFTLSDEDGRIVFSSINNLEETFYSKPMRKGIYRTCCRIPANLLNSIVYRVSLNCFGKSYGDLSAFSNILAITVKDGALRRGDYTHAYGGVVRPELEWRTVPADRSIF